MFGLFTKHSRGKYTAAKGAKAARQPAQLGVECLEERKLLTVSPPVNGVLTIVGTDLADHVTVHTEPHAVVLSQKALKVGTGGILGLRQDVVVEENGVVTGRFNAANVTKIVFEAHQGDDYFRNDTNIDSSGKGGQGNDTMIGGGGHDEFSGRKGNDSLFGRGGVDSLFGDDDNDYLDGGADGVHDNLFGGTGPDTFAADKFYGPGAVSIFQAQNRDTPLDFNAAEGDKIDWGFPVVLAQ